MAEWKRRITRREFEAWVSYYRAYPFDDRSRYYRPAALVAAVAGHAKDRQKAVQDNLDWLAPDPALAELSDADVRTLRAFGVKKPGAT